MVVEYGCFIVKPDAHIRSIDREVLSDIKEACGAQDTRIVFVQTRILSLSGIVFIYQNIAGKPFFADFAKLMQEAPSTLMFVQGPICLNAHLKEIRGSRPSTTGDPATGIRGKYCSVVEVSEEDIRQWEAGAHPRQDEISRKMICNVLHCSDNETEALKAFWVFATPCEKMRVVIGHPLLLVRLLCLLLGRA